MYDFMIYLSFKLPVMYANTVIQLIFIFKYIDLNKSQ